MNIAEAAKQLDGCEYPDVGNPTLFAVMKTVRLVAVYGASDDLMEFRGAINEEIGAYEGTKAYVTSKGLPLSDCESGNECPYFIKELESAMEIEALWCAKDEPAWTFKTTIPHATYNVMEDGEVFCRGIVFSLDDVK